MCTIVSVEEFRNGSVQKTKSLKSIFVFSKNDEILAGMGGNMACTGLNVFFLFLNDCCFV